VNAAAPRPASPSTKARGRTVTLGARRDLGRAVKILEERAEELEVPARRRDRTAADDHRDDAVRRRDVVLPVLRGRGRQVHLRDFRDGIYARRWWCASRSVSWPRWTRGSVPFFCPQQARPRAAAGCTIVVKPAAETPLSLFAMADIFAEAGLPRACCRGSRWPRDGRALTPTRRSTSSPSRIQCGRQEIAKIAADKLKPCSLNWAASPRPSSSRTPTWTPRFHAGVLRPDELRSGVCGPDPHPGAALAYDEVVQKLSAAVAAMPIGLPDDAGAMIGPLISERQRERVEGYIRKASRKVPGSSPRWPARGLDSGWFVQPTVFADVDNSMS